MNQPYQKYIPFRPVDLPDRTWPSRTLNRAPVWCSVDLRDGNQALVNPMNMEEKLEFFHALCDVGFKEIEVGFPSASEMEFAICRALIEGGHIPEDVTIQVLVQAREHLIRRTFEAIRGAKKVIVHFYNSTSALQRKVVFGRDMDGIIDIAVQGARLIRELTDGFDGDTDIRFEYSPESFTGTEMDNAVAICESVMAELRATAERPVILNLPSTVEMSTPNAYADQIEYFIRHLNNRDAAIISVHPHNDRGTGTAAAELAMLAGAQRVEGTLFGNGERTGNLDVVNMGLNLYTQGIDPALDFAHLPALAEMYERCTGLRIHERHPYVGELVFTAFSGSHQDAIDKGMDYMRKTGGDHWEVPYLPIDPADVGRQYESIIRINSQSGKGGAAYIMQTAFGYHLPKEMRPEFGAAVKRACDTLKREITPEELLGVFRAEYLEVPPVYTLLRHEIVERNGAVRFTGTVRRREEDLTLAGEGNGPLDAFFRALEGAGVSGYRFLSYHEHAISQGSDSKAIAYIQLAKPDGGAVFGVGIEANINMASIQGVLCALSRAEG